MQLVETKMLARILLFLAILEVAPLIRAHEKRAASVLFGNSCKIQSKALPTEFLNLMPKEKAGLAATAATPGSPLSAKWRVDQLTLESNIFFEIYNRQFETYLTNYYYSDMWMVAGAKQNYVASNKRDTLWIIEPAQVNAPVTIKHAVTGSYLTVPRGSFPQRNVMLSSSPSGDESKWEIIC